MVNFYDVSRFADFRSLKSLFNDLSGKFDNELVSDIRRDAALMLVIERHLVSILNKLQLLKEYSAFQFPANVRYLRTSKNVSAAHEYDTHNIHVDAWSGAPSDSANFMLYLNLQGAEPPYVQFYEFLVPSDEILVFRGPYQEAIKRFPVKKLAQPAPFDGQLVHFDNFAPHQTVSSSVNSGWRLSLDVRVRTGNPYQINGAFIDQERFTYYLPGNPGLGYYWSISLPYSFSSVDEKVSNELAIASSFHSSAYKLRKSYLDFVRSDGDWNIKKMRSNL